MIRALVAGVLAAGLAQAALADERKPRVKSTVKEAAKTGGHAARVGAHSVVVRALRWQLAESRNDRDRAERLSPGRIASAG